MFSVALLWLFKPEYWDILSIADEEEESEMESELLTTQSLSDLQQGIDQGNQISFRNNSKGEILEVKDKTKEHTITSGGEIEGGEYSEDNYSTVRIYGGRQNTTHRPRLLCQRSLKEMKRRSST
ncbi:hypothetical protein E2542_SST14282 [Spatholobus suberectus]|nr:hypothetical protein E2542_SST14282 [Spatholobus suberectus]